MANYRVTLIIPVFNGLSYTSACVKNLADNFGGLSDESTKFDIIICDDGSTDGTSDWIARNYPDIHVLKGDGNLWWSGGINLGVQYAIEILKSDYVLWWNNDIKAAPDYFSNLQELLKKTETNVIIGSKIYYDNDSSRIWSMGGIFNPRNGRKYMTAMGEPDSIKYNEVFDADWLPGMGTIIHTSVFKSIGFLDAENFPQYHGDSDFTYRAKLAGFRIQVFPQLKIWNDKTNSGFLHQNNFKTLIKSLHDKKSSYYMRKDIIFYNKFSESWLAYKTLVEKYGLYIGGFLKWKVLNVLGISKISK